MGFKFNELVTESLSVERELRLLTPGRPSLRCFIAECLARADASYEAVEEVKERLADTLFGLKSGCATFIRDLTRQIASGRFPEPPAKQRIGALYFNQKDQAVMELGAHSEKLFLLWTIAAEVAYQQNPEVFGAVEDLGAHKARVKELGTRSKELYSQFPTTWSHGDLFIGRVTSDGAALITLRLAANEVPVHPPATAGERLIDYLLKKEHETKDEAKAA